MRSAIPFKFFLFVQKLNIYWNYVIEERTQPFNAGLGQWYNKNPIEAADCLVRFLTTSNIHKYSQPEST